MSLTYPLITVHPCDHQRAIDVSRVIGHRCIIREDKDWDASTIGVDLPWDWPGGLVEQSVRRIAPGWTPIITVEPSPMMQTLLSLRSSRPAEQESK